MMLVMGKKLCFKNCYDCTSPYALTAQRWCYDSKIDYLFKNPLIQRKQQKKNPLTKKNEIAYTFEVGGFEVSELYNMEGDKLAENVMTITDIIYRAAVESLCGNT